MADPDQPIIFPGQNCLVETPEGWEQGEVLIPPPARKDPEQGCLLFTTEEDENVAE